MTSGAVDDKRADDRRIKELRDFQRSSPTNKRCFDCNEMMPQYVCVDFNTFVCTSCSGIHREFGHRVKSISMSKFTEAEVKNLLKFGGNEAAQKIWRAKHDASFRPSGGTDGERTRNFIRLTYIDKKWQYESPRATSRDEQPHARMASGGAKKTAASSSDDFLSSPGPSKAATPSFDAFSDPSPPSNNGGFGGFGDFSSFDKPRKQQNDFDDFGRFDSPTSTSSQSTSGFGDFGGFSSKPSAAPPLRDEFKTGSFTLAPPPGSAFGPFGAPPPPVNVAAPSAPAKTASSGNDFLAFSPVNNKPASNDPFGFTSSPAASAQTTSQKAATPFDAFGSPVGASANRSSFDAFAAPASTGSRSASSSFDAFGAAAPSTPASSGFDAFGSVSAPAAPVSPGFGAFGAPTPAFEAFGASPAAAKTSSGSSFGAFGASSGQSATASAFDAFGASPVPAKTSSGSSFGAFGASSGPSAPSQAGFDAFGSAPSPAGSGFGAFGAASPVSSSRTNSATTADPFGGFGARTSSGTTAHAPPKPESGDPFSAFDQVESSASSPAPVSAGPTGSPYDAFGSVQTPSNQPVGHVQSHFGPPSHGHQQGAVSSADPFASAGTGAKTGSFTNGGFGAPPKTSSFSNAAPHAQPGVGGPAGFGGFPQAPQPGAFGQQPGQTHGFPSQQPQFQQPQQQMYQQPQQQMYHHQQQQMHQQQQQQQGQFGHFPAQGYAGQPGMQPQQQQWVQPNGGQFPPQHGHPNQPAPGAQPAPSQAAVAAQAPKADVASLKDPFASLSMGSFGLSGGAPAPNSNPSSRGNSFVKPAGSPAPSATSSFTNAAPLPPANTSSPFGANMGFGMGSAPLSSGGSRGNSFEVPKSHFAASSGSSTASPMASFSMPAMGAPSPTQSFGAASPSPIGSFAFPGGQSTPQKQSSFGDASAFGAFPSPARADSMKQSAPPATSSNPFDMF